MGFWERLAEKIEQKQARERGEDVGKVLFLGTWKLVGNTLTADRTEYGVDGARATVDEGGNYTEYATSRYTATRIVGLGVFALAVPKHKTHKVDKRTVTLTVTGQGFHLVQDVPPDKVTEAREFAALVNERGR